MSGVKEEMREPTQEERAKIKELRGISGISLRAEGDINQYWEFTFTPESEGEEHYKITFYAYESSPRYTGSDASVWNDDQELCDFLEELFDRVAPHYPDNFDEGGDCAEFEITLHQGALRLETVMHQRLLDYNI